MEAREAIQTVDVYVREVELVLSEVAALPISQNQFGGSAPPYAHEWP